MFSCKLSKSVNDPIHFKNRDTEKTFNLLKGPFDYKYNHIIYIFECKPCNMAFLI